MQRSKNNPSNNELPPGLQADQLEIAVKQSGYPLQTTVAVELQPHFKVTEEWGFIDRETDTKRTLDLFAYKQLDKPIDSDSRHSPSVLLLIECKRSEMPFIFFKSTTDRETRGFPAILSLPSKIISVRRDAKTTDLLPAAQAIGLADHSFVKGDVTVCNAFSKVSRKGKDLDLSGSEPYNNIILPLLSAMHHAYEYYKISYDQPVQYPQLTLALCVVDAPMIIADATKNNNDLTLTPWVRIIRQEAFVERRGEISYEDYGVDIIHCDFLKTFIDQHLLPFAVFFRDCILNQRVF